MFEELLIVTESPILGDEGDKVGDAIGVHNELSPATQSACSTETSTLLTVTIISTNACIVECRLSLPKEDGATAEDAGFQNGS